MELDADNACEEQSDMVTKEKIIAKAESVYQLIETWLSDESIIKALEDAHDPIYSTARYKLDVTATIAAYFLFYMVTINVQSIASYGREAFELNVKLITELREKVTTRMELTPMQVVSCLTKAGFSLDQGFVWICID